jgi:hypothetical protein
MRYWAFFLGKLITVAALSQGFYLGISHLLPAQEAMRLLPAQDSLAYQYPPRFAHDLWFTAGIGVWFLLTCGLVYAAIWDQRYRCRVCLRRLRMPIETGSWSRMLQLGRPEIEYICTYGHGRLNFSEVQISGSENPNWTPQQQDMWTELTGAGKDERQD